MDKEIINNIKKLDKPGRDKFIELCKRLNIKYIEPSREDLCYDCLIEYKGKQYIVELKNRSSKYKNYDTLFLEKGKYERLLNNIKKLNVNGAYYICWIDNDAYIYNIKESFITENLQEKWMNNITADKNTKKISKLVYILKKSDAKILHLD